MANTYFLIASTTLTTNTASVVFSSIPATYTDLKLVTVIRSNENFDYYNLIFNTTQNTSFSSLWSFSNGSTVSSGTRSDGNISATSNNSPYASNTFAVAEVYIPNYLDSQNKKFSAEQAQENTASNPVFMQITSNNWANTASINRLEIVAGDGGTKRFVSGSKFFLYGISNA
jgi:hypothetical protein